MWGGTAARAGVFQVAQLIVRPRSLRWETLFGFEGSLIARPLKEAVAVMILETVQVMKMMSLASGGTDFVGEITAGIIDVMFLISTYSHHSKPDSSYTWCHHVR